VTIQVRCVVFYVVAAARVAISHCFHCCCLIVFLSGTQTRLKHGMQSWIRATNQSRMHTFNTMVRNKKCQHLIQLILNHLKHAIFNTIGSRFKTWHNRILSMKRYEYCCSKALLFWKKRIVIKCFIVWLSSFRKKKKLYQNYLFCVGQTNQKLLAKQYLVWRSNVQLQTTTKKIVVGIIRRWTGMQLTTGWRSWCTFVTKKNQWLQQEQRLKMSQHVFLRRTMVNKYRNTLQQSFYVWYKWKVVDQKQHHILGTFIKKWRHNQLLAGWRKFKEIIQQMATMEMNSLAKQNHLKRYVLKKYMSALHFSFMQLKYYCHMTSIQSELACALSLQGNNRLKTLRRCCSKWRDQIMQKVYLQYYVQKYLLYGFKQWCRYSRLVWYEAMRGVMVERTKDLDSMFDAREAIRKWKYIVSLMKMKKAYALIVGIHEERIHVSDGGVVVLQCCCSCAVVQLCSCAVVQLCSFVLCCLLFLFSQQIVHWLFKCFPLNLTIPGNDIKISIH
jgi:hypothetical protein